MNTATSYENVKQEFGVELGKTGRATRYAGLPAFIAFLDRLKLRERLSDLIGKSQAAAVLEVMMGIFVGADSMEAIATAAKDPVIKDFVGSPVSETQITRTLKKLRPSQIQSLHEFSLSLALLDIAGGVKRYQVLELDIDATHKEKFGHQEGVEIGYVGGDKLERCYQYLFVRNENLKTLLYGTIRGGAAHSQNDFMGFLSMLLPMFPGWYLHIRADSGFFNEDAFELMSKHGAYFYVKAPMTDTRKAQAASPYLKWVADDEDPGVEYAIYETNTKADWIWREVFKRVTTVSENEPEKFETKIYCVATNDLKRGADRVYDYYNVRATIENTNDEFKDDYSLGKIVTKWFHVNDVITQATIMLFQLMSHFKRHCLDKALQAKELKTLRREIFVATGRLVSTARRTIIRIVDNNFDCQAYARFLMRVSRLESVMKRVLALDTT
jgi:hypothetical protein